MEKRNLINHRGIRRKILTNTITITVVLALVLVGVMIYFMSASASSILQSTLQSLAKTSAQSVESNLHILTDRILLAKDDEMLSDEKATKDQKQAVLSRIETGIEFMWLALYDKDGKLYTGSSASPANITDDGTTFYDDIISTGNLSINDTVKGSEGFEIQVGAPVVNAKGDTISIIVGSYKYDVLDDALVNINVGSNGTAFIVNHEGKIMAHKDDSNLIGEMAVETELESTKEVDEIFKQLQLGQTSTVEFDKEGNDMFLSFSPVRGTEWSLVILSQKDDFTAANTQAIAISVVVTLFLIFLSVIASANMSKRIQRPLGRVTDRIAEVANGDLHTAVEIENTKDETETLSVALNNTMIDINRITSELTRVLGELSSNNLNTSIEGEFKGDFVKIKDALNKIIDYMNSLMYSIQQGTGQVLETSKIVSSSAESVKISSDSQSESIKKLNEETASIQGNIVEVRNSTKQVSSLIDKVREELAGSQSDMKKTINAMDSINTNSDEITAISKLLEDISFQTNILSLNASVEAVNAGYAGKGFAVVADEVKALAEKSGESSKKTRVMIEQSKESVSECSICVDRLAESLIEVLDTIQQISDITNVLTVAVETQTSSLENITSQVNNINMLAAGNLKTSNTSAEASRDLTEEINSLRETTDAFKLRGHKDGNAGEKKGDL